MKRTVKLVSDSDNVIRLPFEFCIQCGTKKGLEKYAFEETEKNPVAEFAKLAGDVGILVEYALNKPHKVEARFCNSCMRRFMKIAKMQQVVMLVGLIGVFLGIVTSSLLHSYTGMPFSIIPFAISLVFLIVTRIFSRFYKWKNSPNITKVNKRTIILKVPGYGKLVCKR